MLTAIQQQTKTTTENKTSKHQDLFIFVLLLNDGRIVIGQASNPCKRIAAINSGMNPAIKQTLCVNRVLNIKEVNETRTLPSVVHTFCERYGDNKVVVV